MTDPTASTQGAEAIIERINKQNEQILSAAQTASSGFLRAYEKALRQLASFQPGQAASSQLEWLQALATAQATFIEEATSAYIAAAREAGVPTAGSIADNAVVDQVREFNEQIVNRARAAGLGMLDSYEKALRDIADFETKTANASQLEWVQAVANANARFLTDIGSTYANVVRTLLT
jgi:hypothetical protein